MLAIPLCDPATMFVLGGLEPAVAAGALRRLRADAATRNSALAVLCPQSDLDQEDALRAAAPFPPMPEEARCLSQRAIVGTFSNPVGG